MARHKPVDLHLSKLLPVKFSDRSRGTRPAGFDLLQVRIKPNTLKRQMLTAAFRQSRVATGPTVHDMPEPFRTKR